MKIMKWIIPIVCICMIGCATVTIRPDGGPKIKGRPDYKESKNYFFWGLAGEHTIKIDYVCTSKPATQMQSQFTFLDVVLNIITIGIYAPKTAKVWCEKGGSK